MPPSRTTPPVMAPKRRHLAAAGLAVGAWALVPPYAGPGLATAARVEVADHVMPAIAVLAIAAASLWAGTRGVDPTLVFLAGLGIVLAGFWMTVTHVPLVLQAVRGEAPWGATVHHSTPGLAVLALGAFWSATFGGKRCRHEGHWPRAGSTRPGG